MTFAALLLLTAAARADLVREGPEFQVNTFTPRDQRQPGVAMSPGGEFVIVWESGSYYGPAQDGSRSGIFGQRHDAAGGPVGPEFQVNTYTTGDQFDAAVAVSAAGRFVISWSSGYYSSYYAPPGQDGSELGAFVQPFAPDGTPAGPELQANTYTTSRQHRSAVGTDAAGNFVVVWQSSSYYSTGGQDGSGPGVFAQRFDSTGTPLGPEFQVNVFTTGNQSSAALAVEPSGSFVVVWQSGYYGYQDGSYTGVFGRRFASTGTPLGPEFQVNVFTTGNQFAPAIAAAPGGGFVVVWTSESYYGVDQDGSRSGVFGRRFDATGAPLGGEFQAHTYTTLDQFEPVVAADAAGQFVVAWSSYYQDGSGTGIFAQLFSSLGVAEGPEFQVNTTTTGYQSDPAIGGGPTGHFVVTWRGDYEGGGAARDIIAQRLRVAGPLRALAGSVLRLQDDLADPTAKQLLVRSTDAAITLGGGDGSTDDPTLSGGQLRVRSATFDDTYDLPAANWRTIGAPGANEGYLYRDRTLGAGPVLAVKVKSGRLLRIVARGAALGHDLGANPDPVTVVLQTGALGHRHCMTFGGTARFRPGERFRALGAPGACAP
jgi:hypothetical protein